MPKGKELVLFLKNGKIRVSRKTPTILEMEVETDFFGDVVFNTKVNISQEDLEDLAEHFGANKK